MARHPDYPGPNSEMVLSDSKQAQLREGLQGVAVEPSATGSQAFFNRLARNLARTLNTNSALVGLVDEQASEPSIKTVAAVVDDKPIGNFSYTLADTPGENVFDREVCAYPSELQAQFPNDKFLVEMHAESYLGAPLFDAAGQPAGIIAVFDTAPMNDIAHKSELLKVYTFGLTRELERMAFEQALSTCRSSLEEMIEQRTADLRHANKELESFSYSVSHDLRAPLRTIDGFSRALQEDYGEQLDETANGYLRRIYSASRRMGKLIDDILLLSRISRREMQREPVDLSALAQEIATELQQREPRPDARVVIHPALKTSGDSHLLRIALENLLNNAWKYSRDTPKALIEFGSSRQNGKNLFYVRDNGTGFDIQYADKLFGIFQRLHGSDYEGTGIGLAAVKRAIDRHHGEIWAEAGLGVGACFYFTLSPR